MAASLRSFSFSTVYTAVCLMSLFSFCIGVQTVQCTKIDKCSCRCDGRVFDVSKIGSSDPTKPAFSNIQDRTIHGMTYDYNGCTGVTLGNPSISTCSGSVVCATITVQGVTQIFGIGELDPTYSWDGSANAPVAVFHDADLGAAAHITMVCDASAGQTTVTNTKTNSDVYLELRSADICPGGGGGGGASSSTTLSVGSVLLIVLVSLLVVYVASGILYLQVRHRGEGRYLPQAEFWRALPSNIKAGFSFTYSMTLGRVSGKRAQYDEV